jgi:hypothetical protein
MVCRYEETEWSKAIWWDREVIGLSLLKNGRKLKGWGYDGTVSNEHKVMNNRHPTWSQTRDEIQYLRES